MFLMEDSRKFKAAILFEQNQPLVIEEICFKIDIFFGFTDPPYKTIGFFILNLFLINFLICITWFSKSLDFGTRPVPIDHTGS